ncbi:SAVMC3_10250 family protein [Streptomyces spinosirectus]
MRELVYLSDAKLRQFVPEGRRRTWVGRRLTSFRLDVSTPVGGGGVEVGLAQGGGEPAGAGRLAGVVGQVEEQALWYEDPQARAGRWVWFEAPFNVVVRRDTVLFLDAPAARAGEPEPDGPRLLLHGSAAHLLMDAPEASMDPRELGVNRSALHFVVQDLRRTPLPDADHLTADPAVVRPDVHADHMVDMVLRASNASPGSAAWMRGYARVTRSAPPGEAGAGRPGHPAVVTTPLYVEYAHDLPS